MFRFYARENKLVLMTRVGKDVSDQTTVNIKIKNIALKRHIIPTPIGEAIASTVTGITITCIRWL